MLLTGKQEVPVLYLLFYKFFKEKASNSIFITYSLAKETLSRVIHNIPRKYYYMILHEMEGFKLLRKIGGVKNLRYEFTGKNADKVLDRGDLF